MNKRTFAFIAVGIVLLAGIFFLVKNRVPTTPESLEKTFDFVISEDKVTSAPPDLKANAGDWVTISVMSDEDDEIHIHGYDLTLDLRKGVSSKISFSADFTGRFPLELHHLEKEIGALEVLPK